MSTILEFGKKSKLQLDLPGQMLVAEHAHPRVPKVIDEAAAIKAALQSPIGLPRIQQMVFPGDRVLLAIEEGLPAAPKLLAGAVDLLVAAGVAPTDITLLQTKTHQKLTRDNLATEIPDGLRHQLRLTVHDPADREQLSYLATSAKQEAIYFNRSICDADFVLPIGCQRPPDSPDDFGGCSCLFPTFADAATQKRFNSPKVAVSKKSRDSRLREATEANWLLGVTMYVRVIPGDCGGVAHVLSGTVDGLDKQACELCEAAWRFPVSRKASLIVAAINGGRDQQTWQNVARSLAAVLPFVEEDGAVVLCTDLTHRPGRSLQRLAGASSLDDAEKAIRRDRTADAVTAQLLINALRQVRVYLLSKLTEEAVEDLGMAYVSDPGEIVTLARHHDSCIVLGNAHRAALQFEAAE